MPTLYCADLEGWSDSFNDTCAYYVNNDEPGCPNEGHLYPNTTTNITANEAW